MIVTQTPNKPFKLALASCVAEAPEGAVHIVYKEGGEAEGLAIHEPVEVGQDYIKFSIGPGEYDPLVIVPFHAIKQVVL
jgi:hypothetical protein